MAPDPSRQPYRRVLHRSYRILTRNADMRYSAPSSERVWAGRPAPDGSNRPEVAKPVHGRRVRTGVRLRRGCPRVRRVEVGRFRSCRCRIPRVERSTGTRPPTVRARTDDSVSCRTGFPGLYTDPISVPGSRQPRTGARSPRTGDHDSRRAVRRSGGDRRRRRRPVGAYRRVPGRPVRGAFNPQAFPCQVGGRVRTVLRARA